MRGAQQVRTSTENDPTCDGAAGKLDDVHQRMRAQGRPSVGSVPRHDVEDALWHARLDREMGRDKGRDARELGRLEHDRAATRERRRPRPASDVEGIVPGLMHVLLKSARIDIDARPTVIRPATPIGSRRTMPSWLPGSGCVWP